MTSIRKPPLLAKQTGRCRWCGEAIEPRLKKDGKPHATQPTFHKHCSWEYRCAQVPSLSYESLVARDGERCRSCGYDRETWEPVLGTRGSKDCIGYVSNQDLPTPPRIHQYCRIELRIVLEVDHVIPLWKVAVLASADRRWYFTIENLQLLCLACHRRKSAVEAAERAKLNRIEAKRVRGKTRGRREPLPF